MGAFEPMDRGQAERLMPFLAALLARAGLGWRDLGGLVAGTGPGNFTGVRIAVAAARGLALGLGVPARGVSAFALLRAHSPGPDCDLVTLPAPRGQVQGQIWRGGRGEGRPFLFDPDAPPEMPGVQRVLGAEAARIGAHLGVSAVADDLAQDLPARLAAAAPQAPAGRPAPLYVRPPDALPPSEAPPRLLP
jgi:tRNA threonylcarbamoyl adenosine modification protein YeaZ